VAGGGCLGGPWRDAAKQQSRLGGIKEGSALPSLHSPGNQWTWQKYECDWTELEIDWEPPTLPDGTEWDPEDEDSRHYLNGFVGKGKECEYLNPGTDAWALKHIAAQKRLEGKSSSGARVAPSARARGKRLGRGGAGLKKRRTIKL